MLDYGALDDLVLLGTVEIATGRSHGPEAVPDWPGPVVERQPYRTLAEALAAPPQPGREGLAHAARHPDAGHLFLRLDGRDYRARLWQQVRPSADWTPHSHEPDQA